jgi:C1A family cysteine protease
MNHDELRRAIEQSDAGWEIADEPIDAESKLGYLPSEGVPPLDEQERLGAELAEEEALGAAPPTYPPTYDGRRYATPIRDQGNCGSCVAFAACATVESTMGVEQHKHMDLSEAYLFYCVAEGQQGRRCDGPQGGWYPKKALDVFTGKGVPDVSQFPYRAGDQKCNVKQGWQSHAVKIARWAPLNRPAQMKEWIAKHGAAVGSMKVYEDFQLYDGGIYRYVAGKALGGHAVCVVGYNDPEGCWLIKNSWGKRWGDHGYVRIAYGQCGIDSGMLGVEGVKLPAAAFREEAGAVPIKA